jgi:cyclic beta-1,2-glucan synthetase
MPPASIAVFLLGWTVLPGSPLVWTAIGLAPLVVPILLRLAQIVARPPVGQSGPVFVRTTAEDVGTDLARASMQLIFLAYQASEMVHAIFITLVRLVVTQRRLLEWEPSAATAQRTGPPVVAVFVREMRASPATALVGFVLIVLWHPIAFPAAAPLLALWASAPLVACALSQPAKARRVELSDEDRQFLHGLALKTWRYFDTFAGPAHHGLPPDNVQMSPNVVVAARTSPTNIGMGLLATLAAHDFAFVTTDELIERVDATLTTVEGLQRFEGHLLNWSTPSHSRPWRRRTCPRSTAEICRGSGRPFCWPRASVGGNFE